MSHPADHAHSHDPRHDHGAGGLDRTRQRQRLALTLCLSASYLVAEVVGGLWTGSLALLADAGHMLSDVGALGLSLFALWLASRPAPAARTYGYHRIEILAALANGVALGVVAIFIALEAIKRASHPPAILGLPMLAIATGGLLVNLAGLLILHAERNGSLNLRGAWLHVASDALGSVGAMAAGACIWLFGWRLADPIASALIALLILHSAFTLLRETVDVLLEAAPPHLDVAEIEGAMQETPGVASVHDLHVWTITSGLVSLSCHIACQESAAGHAVLSELQGVLRQRFSIHHATIQIEPEDFEESVRVC